MDVRANLNFKKTAFLTDELRNIMMTEELLTVNTPISNFLQLYSNF